MQIQEFYHNLVSDCKRAGCPTLFLSSAANSAYFGEKTRKAGLSMKMEDIEFRKRVEEQNRLDTVINNDIQLEMKRDSYQLGQRYLRVQTELENEGRRKMVEFQHFDKHCWSSLMATSIHAFLKEQQTKADSRTVTPIKALLAKTDVNAASRMNIKEYADFCDAFQEVMAGCPYVDIIPGQWRKKSLSTISEPLTVNYVLKGLPTIILFPVVCGDTFRIECSSWGFNKGLTAISFHNFFEQRITEGLPQSDETMAKLALTAGWMVDTYLTVENHLPLFYAHTLQNTIEKNPALEKFYRDQYAGLKKTLDIVSDTRYLGPSFSDEDLNRIAKSFDDIHI